jgi:class 3 adenylate cyclase
MLIGPGVRNLGIYIRAGLHTGGVKIVLDGIADLAVNIVAFVMGLAIPGDVLVSSTVKDLVAGAGFEFEDRRAYPLRCVSGEWRIFAVRQ